MFGLFFSWWDGYERRLEKKGPARQVLSVLWKLLYYNSYYFCSRYIAVKIQCISSFVVCVCVCEWSYVNEKLYIFLGKVNIRLKINEIWKKLKREKLGKDTHTQNTKSDLNNITVRVSPTLTTTHSTKRVNENEVGEESGWDVWTEFVRGESTTKMLRIIRSRWIENKIHTHTHRAQSLFEHRQHIWYR